MRKVIWPIAVSCRCLPPNTRQLQRKVKQAGQHADTQVVAVRLPTLLLILAAMVLAAFFLGRRRALSLARPAGGVRSLHSLPKYYGYYAALGAVVPGIALLADVGGFQ